jgi:oligoribonuclease
LISEIKQHLQGPEIAIQQSEEVLSSMNPWCIDHHGASGLTQRCRDSTTSIKEAEEQVREWPSFQISKT